MHARTHQTKASSCTRHDTLDLHIVPSWSNGLCGDPAAAKTSSSWSLLYLVWLLLMVNCTCPA